MKYTITLLLLFSTIILSAQSDFAQFHHESNKINTTGMYVLGAWALTNITASSIGWSRTNSDAMYFHQMNVFWNVVNLSIASFSIYNSFNADSLSMSQEEVLAEHIKLENLYLINAGLDILYMGTALTMKKISEKKHKSKSILNGYGNSILLQGGFLFVFDLVMYGLSHSARMQFLSDVSLNIGADRAMVHVAFSL